MSIILGIIGAIFALVVVVTLLRIAWYILTLIVGLILYLLKPALFIGAVVLIYTLFGIWGIGLAIGLILLFYFLGIATQDKVERQVKKIFHTYEMSTLQDVYDQLDKSTTYEKLLNTINKFLDAGRLEEVDFGRGGEKVYRWTERRNYSKGVITNHIELD
ncbi:hypothetical protein ACQCT3_02260 [Sutcliffiella horikoshii]|uniref:hypothetical protein n=1 Tax=Sutcliffiella horikoshii TaxID=79883 RepID=UPI003CF27B7C